MGIITKIKGAFGGTAETDEEEYECESCGATYPTPANICEACGGDQVVRVS